MKIEIKTNSDHHDCETCGGSYADGGDVYIDGELVLSRKASAHCFNGRSYDDHELLVMALAKLGHTVTVDDSPYHVTYHDDEYHGPLED